VLIRSANLERGGCINSSFLWALKMNKLVYGVGINDADYVVKPKIYGKQRCCPFYKTWKSMLSRCYGSKYQAKRPTYIGCMVCEEWHSFMAFRAWMMKHDWAGKHLDKDLLSAGNKAYSPDYCIFVFSQINTLLLDNSADRGEWPIGVCWNVGVEKFIARCNINGKTKHLGVFTDHHQAHRAWQAFKIKAIQQAAVGQTDAQLIAALNRIAAKIQSDFNSNLETKSYF
jgi:hypothetical protein